jgi:hypothetical protein
VEPALLVPPPLDIPPWMPATIAQYVKAEYAAAVDRIYEEAFRENGYFDDERRQKLFDAAHAYEDHAREISLVEAVERKRDVRGRWTALTISNTLQRRFGLPMYGTTATITAVILDRKKIATSTVQSWCAPSTNKGSKIAP